MKKYIFTIAKIDEKSKIAKFEFLIRKYPGVISASVKDTALNIVVQNNIPVSKIQQIVVLTLNSLKINKITNNSKASFINTNAQDTEQTVNSNINAKENKQVDDFTAELNEHKKAAIYSLLALGAFEVIRRINPTLYLSTTILRSIGVLYMSKSLLKSGLSDAIKDRRANADTLTVTAVIASVLAKNQSLH